MEFEEFTLSNGLRVIHQETNSYASHCGLIINVGSRDELDHEQGIAHFLEHTLFKGTKKRKAYHILNRIDAVGGELNAYTSKEETVVHCSFQNHHYERAIELVADIVFQSTFPEKEVEKEKAIIIDEINAYQDSPGEQIFDDYEELIYANHPLGRLILGKEEDIERYTAKDIKAFKDRTYGVNKMVFSSVGNITAKKLQQQLEKHFGQIDIPVTQDQRRIFNSYVPCDEVVKRDIFQAHMIYGNVSYSYQSPNRRAMILLNNILGGPAMNSRLNLNISEKYGYAYNLESNYTTYTDTGWFGVYLGTDSKYLNKSLKLIQKELTKLKDVKLGKSQFKQAQEQLIGQLVLSQESGVSQMIALGKSLLAFNKVDTLAETKSKIEKITAEQLQEVANDNFNFDQMSTLVFSPSKAEE